MSVIGLLGVRGMETVLKFDGPTRLKVVGNTYPIRQLLKALGFKWEPKYKWWTINLNGLSDQQIRNIIKQLYNNGVKINVRVAEELLLESEYEFDPIKGVIPRW